MKTIDISFEVDLNSEELLTQSLGGKIKGKFISISDDAYTGVKYFLNCAPGLNAFYAEIEYNEDILFKRDAIDENYVGLYYNLTTGEADLGFEDFSHPVGKWHYDLIILDGSTKSEYLIKKGSKSLALLILIRKDLINQYLSKKKNIKFTLKELLNSDGNPGVRFEKMSYNSFTKIKSLQNKTPNDSFFDLNLLATVNFLISNFIDQLAKDQLILNTVNKTDLNLILNIQKYLFKNIDKPFPSIEILAKEVNMSETKFKNLYKKITGETPNNSYLKHKLLHAKSLLEKGSLSISEVSDELFSNNTSYFSTKFKEQFGIPPKEFVDKLN